MRWRHLLGSIALVSMAVLAGCSGSPTGPADFYQAGATASQPDSVTTSTEVATALPNLPKKPGDPRTDIGGTGGALPPSPVLLRHQTSGGLLDVLVQQLVLPLLGGVLINLDAVLVVPIGALLSPATFSMLIPDADFYYYVLGPHGAQFNVPVTLTVSYADADLTGLDPSTIRIAYQNPSTGQWESVNSTRNALLKTVTAQLEHFSAYGLISDAKPTGTTDTSKAK